MEERCEFVEKCPMFRYFSAIAIYVYEQAYCLKHPENCERRKLRLAGQPVPENMLPQGTKLWADDENPPTDFQLPGF